MLSLWFSPHFYLSMSTLVGKGYVNLVTRLPLASQDLTDQPIMKADQTQHAKPSHSNEADPVTGLKEGSKSRSGKINDDKPYRGVSHNGRNRFRAQICDHGKVHKQPSQNFTH